MLAAALTLSFWLLCASALKPVALRNSALRAQCTKEVLDDDWRDYYERTVTSRRYQIIAAPEMEDLAQQIVELYPRRFKWHPTKWSSFPDGTDNIEIGGFLPKNRISGADVLMLASFHDNGATLSQFSVMITLLTSFVDSLTVVLPYYPVGTMERVTTEGQVATANTYAQLFSNLPSCGKPTRLMTYDLHTLQNRFYLHNNACASLQTAIPVLVDRLKASNSAIDCIAFPDDGAAKRFARIFTELTDDFEMVTCGKTRGEGDKRVITIQDGSCAGKRVLIVDDLVQTGGTLFECGRALKAAGALEVSAYVTHGVFPGESWRRFTRQRRDGSGDRDRDAEVDSSDGFCFERFYLTDSIPTVTSMLPRDDVFEILPLSAKIVDDLDAFTKDI